VRPSAADRHQFLQPLRRAPAANVDAVPKLRPAEGESAQRPYQLSYRHLIGRSSHIRQGETEEVPDRTERFCGSDRVNVDTEANIP
jgi:hypothetical protein